MPLFIHKARMKVMKRQISHSSHGTNCRCRKCYITSPVKRARHMCAYCNVPLDAISGASKRCSTCGRLYQGTYDVVTRRRSPTVKSIISLNDAFSF